jgi:hypothetical protein
MVSLHPDTYCPYDTFLKYVIFSVTSPVLGGIAMGLQERIAQLSAELPLYVGGQLEVQNPVERYLYRGEIKTIALRGEDLVVDFTWIAQGVGYPPLPKSWVRSKTRNYVASVDLFPSCEIDSDRIVMQSPYTNELVVLFSRGGSRLDPSRVEGMSLE